MKKKRTLTEEVYCCDDCGTEIGTSSSSSWKCAKCGGDVAVCCAIVVEITKWDNPKFSSQTNPIKIRKNYHPKCWNDFDKKLP